MTGGALGGVESFFFLPANRETGDRRHMLKRMNNARNPGLLNLGPVHPGPPGVGRVLNVNFIITSVRMQSDKEASQTRGSCGEKNVPHRAARPDSSPRKKRLFGLTIRLHTYLTS